MSSLVDAESAFYGDGIARADDSDGRWLCLTPHGEHDDALQRALQKSPLGATGPRELLEAIDNALDIGSAEPLASSVAARLEGDTLHVAQCGTARAFLVDDAVTELSQVQIFTEYLPKLKPYSGIGKLRSRPIEDEIPVAEDDLLVVVDEAVMLRGGRGPLVKDDLARLTKGRAPADGARAIVEAARGGFALVVRFSDL